MSAIMMDIPDIKGTAVKICKCNYKNDVTGVICTTQQAHMMRRRTSYSK
jgi:hypothetical protein